MGTVWFEGNEKLIIENIETPRLREILKRIFPKRNYFGLPRDLLIRKLKSAVTCEGRVFSEY